MKEEKILKEIKQNDNNRFKGDIKFSNIQLKQHD